MLLLRQEVADMLRVSVRTVDRLRRKGAIRAFSVHGTRVVFEQGEVARYIESRRRTRR